MKKLALLLGLVSVFFVSCEEPKEVTKDERKETIQNIEKEEASEPGEF